MTYTGKLVLVVGASGSGKGVLLKHAKELHSDIIFPLSWTTRVVRPGERQGSTYHFVSKEEFESHVKTGEFLEWATIDSGKLYGTPKSKVVPWLEIGKLVVKEMEVQGVHQVQQILPRDTVLTIYIDAGPWDSLSRRIQGRAPINPEELETRRLRYEYERTFKDEATYVVENLDGKFPEADASFEGIFETVT